MRNPNQTDGDLLKMLKEARCQCDELYRITADKCRALEAGGFDDESMDEMINAREIIINRLVLIENAISQMLDTNEAYEGGRHLPYAAESERRQIRRLISQITELDLQLIKILSEKVQSYKDQTLIIRNKKQISAYLKSSIPFAEGPDTELGKEQLYGQQPGKE